RASPSVAGAPSLSRLQKLSKELAFACRSSSERHGHRPSLAEADWTGAPPSALSQVVVTKLRSANQGGLKM
ncbi:hypothetical protein VDBG_02461, partial [Verticillium alfalfae VaMs.102]